MTNTTKQPHAPEQPADAGPVSDLLGPLPVPCGYLDAGRDRFGYELSDAAWTEPVVKAYTAAEVARAVAAADREWHGKLEAADAEVARLRQAMQDALPFCMVPAYESLTAALKA